MSVYSANRISIEDLLADNALADAPESAPVKEDGAIQADVGTDAPQENSDSPQPRKINVASGVMDADFDIRKFCNALKISRPAFMHSGGDVDLAKGIIARGEEIAEMLLESIGYLDRDEINRLMPIVLPSIMWAAYDNNTPAESMAKLLASGCNSKYVNRLTSKFEAPNDTLVDIRISLSSALASIAGSVISYSFSGDSSRDIDFAAKTITQFAVSHVTHMAPEGASQVGVKIALQALIRECGIVLAKTWETHANAVFDAAEAAPDFNLYFSEIRKAPEKEYQAIEKKFNDAMEAIVSISTKMVRAYETNIMEPARKSKRFSRGL